MALTNNEEELDVTSNGLTNFATALDDLTAYAVVIETQPSTPNQICSITSGNASGNLEGMDEIINISCSTVQYNLGVDVSGLANGNSVELDNNGESLVVSIDGVHNFATALDDGSAYNVAVIIQPQMPNQICSITSGNSLGNLAGMDVVVSIDCSIVQYNVGVDVSGLANGVTLSLLNNAESLDVTSNGLTNFATALDDLTAYAVTIETQPGTPNQICSITSDNPSGNLAGMDEVISISCSTVQYNIGVDVSGLANGNSVEFENNAESLIVNSDGSVNFANLLDDGTSYDVVVTTQPTSPNQMCSVVSGAGMLQGSDVLITVTCTTDQYFVGGMASGIANGNAVTLSLGAEDLDVDANNAFIFLNPLVDESSYLVSIISQPSVPNQTCELSNESGTISGNDITNLSVECITNQYTIGGTVSGLHDGNNLLIQNNNGDELMISSDGDFDFVIALDDLQSYIVSIVEQPTNPLQLCDISNNTGNVAGQHVINITVVCEFGDDLVYKSNFE